MIDRTFPEEKLLNLIKGDKKKPAAVPQTKTNAVPQATPIGLRLKHFVFLPALHAFVRFRLERFALLCLLASAVYYLFIFVFPFSKPEPDISNELKSLSLSAPVSKKIELPEKIGAEAKSYDVYAQSLTRRGIFGSSGNRQDSLDAAPVSTIKDINLVGIISGDNPQAIVEDKKMSKTCYLSEGQYIGDVKIEDIQEGKVILNENGQLYELYL